MEFALNSPEDIIMFSTDSVHTTKPFTIPDTPQLGDFSKDFEGSGIYIMSDVYNIWNEKKTKNKLRGFALAIEKDIDSDIIMLKDILENMQTDEYKYSTMRPYHLGECLLHKKARKIDDLNIFGEAEKTIKINGDIKRDWLGQSFKTGKECFKKQFNSLPLKIE